MNWFAKILPQKRHDIPTAHHDKKNCCENNKELHDFIQKFVTEESLEPAVRAFTNPNNLHDCGCGCNEDDGVEITILSGSPQPNYAHFVPKLDILLAGHQAWCSELEQMMRDKKTSEFNLAAVGEGFMCCIGTWLECEKSGLQNYPEYNELIHDYANLQNCAKTMLDNHQRGHFMDAVSILRGEFAEKSALVQQALFNLMATMLDDQWAAQMA